jgi:DNA invertase Pin-like site-specific DNA recombinase
MIIRSLAACLQSLREGDTLVVWKLDRLGRNLRHLVNTVHDLTTGGIGLRVLTGQGAAIDTTTAAGKLVFGIFAALAEFERELITERTRAGLASARALGDELGITRQTLYHHIAPNGTLRPDGKKIFAQ